MAVAYAPTPMNAACPMENTPQRPVSTCSPRTARITTDSPMTQVSQYSDAKSGMARIRASAPAARIHCVFVRRMAMSCWYL